MIMARKNGPHAGSELAVYVERRILELRGIRTQREIATQAGFPNPNMLTMIKLGDSKLAIDRVATLAEALQTDPKNLLRMALLQEGNQTMNRIFNDIIGTVVSRNEVGWLEELREASGGGDPAVTSRARMALRAIFGR
jgi:hypothetical protein